MSADTMTEDQVAKIKTETDVDYSLDQDRKGVSYIWNLVALYVVFGLSMVVIAWFGIFSEV